ncbi:hypothetical protein CO058_02445 [candidate division WWE3 bacterium CG_4_9_14_0_2_um_filter_35_11]|uniref:Vitamin K epoxide reductase domain-containing protein n=1 Tax=candidate division WWE3 bacterium CG_4_9_14_0_2_um_filter_35_11 TaxID=1975077 RepID=A0A2M8ELH3_UNCKA|nr:MAG: hypothetical protein COV25_02705 [candidate division WWE3 bacterium CG10_big_fil_rev_8_21_14_0_10_35_32]PJC23594.1 MAG: hypothetical protein CO058_02445 [candidate division WWE3 bacterium CG_4_9_14_0_2_um_filter_35_11]
MKMLDRVVFCLCILGVLISTYLLQSKLFGSEILCGVSSCGIVNNSNYSEILGIPVSAFGLLFYTGMAVLVVLKYRRLFFLGSIVGVLFSAYLTYLEAFVLHAWCQWCIMSAWIAFSLFVVGARVVRTK